MQDEVKVTPELLPCGNCVAPARWVENAWRVKCTRPSCGVEGGKFEQKRVAITAWNTRSTVAEEGLREAHRKLALFHASGGTEVTWEEVEEIVAAALRGGERHG